MNFPKKKYRIIYADPPWLYGLFKNNDLKNNSKIKITPYIGMPIDQIKNLDVKSISDKNSILIMWITFPCLIWLKEVFEAWGFEYKTVLFTWIKRNKNNASYFTGLGNYTRSNAEICVLGKQGKGCKVLDKSISQIIDTPIYSHSKKPDIVRQKIVQLFGDLPRIELFARIKAHGWDYWGDDENLNNLTLEHYKDYFKMENTVN